MMFVTILSFGEKSGISTKKIDAHFDMHIHLVTGSERIIIQGLFQNLKTVELKLLGFDDEFDKRVTEMEEKQLFLNSH